MKVHITWVGGACWVLRFDGFSIASDPCLCPKGTVQSYPLFDSTRLEDPVFDDQTFRDIDLWLLTHNHQDHLDLQGASHIEPGSTVFCPLRQTEAIRNEFKIPATGIDWNDSAVVSKNGCLVTVRAIPAFHGTNPLAVAAGGKVNGWLVGLQREDARFRFYVTGDTFFQQKVRSSLRGEKLDLVIANAGRAKAGKSFLSRLAGPFTMGGTELDRMADALNPAHFLPVHFGAFSHYSESLPVLKTRRALLMLKPGETANIPLPF